jgi:uncharacterized protein YbjT (DUF2867 family)
MKIVVIGGRGLVGAKLVSRLRKRGHETVAASPGSGVNTITREGLAEAVADAQVVVDVTNSPSSDGQAALGFFETSGRNLLAAEAAAGVTHHLALSVVGADRLQSGYFQAKLLQENLIRKSRIPYTIVRSTQFFEFARQIADAAAVGHSIPLSPALVQPIAADDVADALADAALSAPVNGTFEVAGPECLPLDEFVSRYLRAVRDSRTVAADIHAQYFGVVLNDRLLAPGNDAHVGAIQFADWLSTLPNPTHGDTQSEVGR